MGFFPYRGGRWAFLPVAQLFEIESFMQIRFGNLNSIVELLVMEP